MAGKFFDYLRVGGFIAYLGLSVFLVTTYKSEFNQEYYWAFKYLWLPALLVGGYIGLKISRKEFGQAISGQGIFLALAFSAVLLLGSAGYVSLVNVQFGPREPVMMGGPVLSKCTTGRGGHTYVVTVDAESVGRPMRIKVGQSVYQSVQVGDRYLTKMYQGALGIYYRK